MAVRAWNAMGGVIDWSAVPIFIDLYGVADPEIFVAALCAVRDIQMGRSGNGGA